MNSDFENQLQRQPIRKVPEDWRKDVLQAVKAASTSQPSTLNPKPSWFHQLFWPCPQAWGAVAAVWVVIFCLNFTSSDSTPVMAAVTPPAPEVMAALRQQRLFKAELIGLAEPAEEPKRFISQPRSELTPTTVAV